MALLIAIAVPPITFATEPVAEQGLPPLDCVINPSVVADLGSSVPGVLSNVRVDRSDLIEQGQVVAELESSVESVALELARARAERDAEINLRRVNASFGRRQQQRTEDLYKRKVISTNDMDERETEARLAGLELRQALEDQRIAQLEHQRAEKILKRRTIQSPISGVVMERFKTIGEYVEDQPVLRVAQLDPLYVEVFVPVEHLGEVREGLRAQVWSEAVPDIEWHASVTRVDRVADIASGTYGVRLELPNPDYKVPAGLRCRVAFAESMPEPAVVGKADEPKSESPVDSGGEKTVNGAVTTVTPMAPELPVSVAKAEPAVAVKADAPMSESSVASGDEKTVSDAATTVTPVVPEPSLNVANAQPAPKPAEMAPIETLVEKAQPKPKIAAVAPAEPAVEKAESKPELAPAKPAVEKAASTPRMAESVIVKPPVSAVETREVSPIIESLDGKAWPKPRVVGVIRSDSVESGAIEPLPPRPDTVATSDIGPSAMLPASEETTDASLPSIAEAAVLPRCQRAGPFKDGKSAERQARELHSGGFEVEVEKQSHLVQVGYRVMSQPLSSREAAKKLIERLLAAGIRDMYLVTGGLYKNHVSLGLYKHERPAQKRVDQLAEKGFEVEIKPWRERKTEYFLAVRGMPTAENTELLSALPVPATDGAFDNRTCETLAGRVDP